MRGPGQGSRPTVQVWSSREQLRLASTLRSRNLGQDWNSMPRAGTPAGARPGLWLCLALGLALGLALPPPCSGRAGPWSGSAQSVRL